LHFYEDNRSPTDGNRAILRQMMLPLR